MSITVDFLTPRLVGERFTDHSIPLEVLKDLSVLEGLVTETAKWLYLNENSERKRVPRGFTDGITIKITDIEDGSAKPKLVLVLASVATVLLPPANQQYFENARDRIISAIEAAENQNRNISECLPDSLLTYFDRLGRSLQDDESIEFRPETPESPVRLNKVTRKKLILASAQVQEYSEEIEIKGLIPEADQDKNTFTIAILNDGQRITAPLDNIFRQDVLTAFAQYKEQQKVAVKGVVQYNRAGRPLKIESIEQFTLLDKLDIGVRLDELALLNTGWMDGKGIAPDKDGLKWLEDMFNSYYNSDALPFPRLFPTAEGGIQAEWSLSDWEVSLEIDLTTKQAEYQAVNIKTGEEDNLSYNLTLPESWGAINKDILVFSEVVA